MISLLKEIIAANAHYALISCPTGAINDNRTIDARKCIAYLTLESKGPIPEDLIRNSKEEFSDVTSARRFVPGIRMQNPIKLRNLNFRRKLNI